MPLLVSEYNCSYFLSPVLRYEIFVAVTVLALLVFVVYFGRVFLSNQLVLWRKYLGLTGVVLVLMGGILNLLARFVGGGCVHDYLNFFNLFAFNMNDLMIDFGIVLVALCYFI
jgi:lipoprotein signal peptidase